VITELHASSALSPADRAATGALADLAFALPPDDPASRMTWSDPDQTVIARDPDGGVAAVVVIVHRDGLLDGRPVRLAGIGGVASHPSVRGRGYGRAALDRAIEAVDAHDPDLTQLICAPRMFGYYAQVGFAPFAGTTWIRQAGERVLLDYEPTRIRPGRLPAPTDGELDLCGPPW
jgi:GNAT superfamily N-acetyltransferase